MITLANVNAFTLQSKEIKIPADFGSLGNHRLSTFNNLTIKII